MPAPCAGGILQRELWVGTDLWRVDAVQATYGAREWHRLSVVRAASLPPGSPKKPAGPGSVAAFRWARGLAGG